MAGCCLGDGCQCPGGGCQCPGDSVHVVARMYITGVLLLGLPVAVLAIWPVLGGMW